MSEVPLYPEASLLADPASPILGRHNQRSSASRRQAPTGERLRTLYIDPTRGFIPSRMTGVTLHV